jgi:hypothetical protein
MRASVHRPAVPAFLAATVAPRALPTSAEKSLFYVAILLCFTISSDLLGKLGWDYAGNGGSFIARFHPTTWLLLPVILMSMVRSGNPLRYLDVVLACPIMAASLLLFLFDLFWAIAYVHQPFTPLLETFVIPIFGFYLIREYDDAMKRHLSLLVHVCVIANGILGLVERVTRTHFISTDMYEDAVFRSSALLGHPLGNSQVTSLYLLTLAVGGGRDLPAWSRLIVFGMEFLALTAFGGRTALIVSIAGLPVVAAAWLWRVRMGEQISARTLKLSMIGLPLLIGAVWGLYMLGFFDDLLIRFIDDYGSSRTREILTTLVGHFQWHPRRQRTGRRKLLVREPAALWRAGCRAAVDRRVRLFSRTVPRLAPRICAGAGGLLGRRLRIEQHRDQGPHPADAGDFPALHVAPAVARAAPCTRACRSRTCRAIAAAATGSPAGDGVSRGALIFCSTNENGAQRAPCRSDGALRLRRRREPLRPRPASSGWRASERGHSGTVLRPSP